VTIYDVFDSEKATRQASYSLDGQEKVSLPLIFEGITTVGSQGEGTLPYSITVGVSNLPTLSDGTHTITVFADYSGDYEFGTYSVQGNCTAIFVINTHSTPRPSPTSTSEPSPTSTPTPTIPEFSWLMILPLFIFILSIAVTVRLRTTWSGTQENYR
jgi:hypothetical protein